MGKPLVWVVNDFRTTIPGSRTLWDDLIDWFDAEFVGGDYAGLAPSVYSAYERAEKKPDVILRNGSYFPALDLPIPQIALFQDILSGQGREMQLDVMRCYIPVFNSAWTQAQFPEAGDRGKVIPLPIDFDLFRPLPDREALREKWGILPNSVCWIGAGSHVKGWDILTNLIKETDFNWCLVVKDDLSGVSRLLPTPENVRLFSRVPQSDLVEVINACSVGLCTSRVETQHLAGLEIGACGLPLVTTNVGAYYNRASGAWGHVEPLMIARPLIHAISAYLDDTYLDDIEDPRTYWLKEGFDRSACEKAWRAVVEEVLNNAS